MGAPRALRFPLLRIHIASSRCAQVEKLLNLWQATLHVHSDLAEAHAKWEGRGVSRGLLLCAAQHLCSIREPNQFQFSTSFLGSLNVYLRLKGQTAIENPLWSSSGNKGQHWNQARVNINPPTSFQVMACASHTRNGSIWFSEGGPVYADPFLLTQDFTASLQLWKLLYGQIIAFLALNRWAP